jgi:hypothetical protein
MNDPLRQHLEAWEREAAAQWSATLRSPAVLQRLGTQITRTLTTQQRIQAALAGTPLDPGAAALSTRLLYLLERLEHQLAALEIRITRLENLVRHD